VCLGCQYTVVFLFCCVCLFVFGHTYTQMDASTPGVASQCSRDDKLKHEPNTVNNTPKPTQRTTNATHLRRYGAKQQRRTRSTRQRLQMKHAHANTPHKCYHSWGRNPFDGSYVGVYQAALGPNLPFEPISGVCVCTCVCVCVCVVCWR